MVPTLAFVIVAGVCGFWEPGSDVYPCLSAESYTLELIGEWDWVESDSCCQTDTPATVGYTLQLEFHSTGTVARKKDYVVEATLPYYVICNSESADLYIQPTTGDIELCPDELVLHAQDVIGYMRFVRRVVSVEAPHQLFNEQESLLEGVLRGIQAA